MHLPALPTTVDNPLSSRHLQLLCPREWDVLIYIANGLSNKEIAERLCVTPKSVKNYCTRLGNKLHQKGAGKVALFASQHRAALRFWYKELTGKLPPPDNK